MYYIIENVNVDNLLLIVDDVFDFGCSIFVLKEKFFELMCLNLLCDICVVCFYYKFKNLKVDMVFDYYIYEFDEWLVFLYELLGLILDEIIEGKFDLKNIYDILLEK